MRKQISENPELDYFMNEDKSDVMFVVEGQRIPALKTLLSVKSRVFSAMFSGEFKESKDKELVIEDTTYEAFKTFVRFIYCDDLVLKDDNDIELFRELYKLCDRYDVSRFERRITDKFVEMSQTLMESNDNFEEVWPKMQSILKIGFEFKIEKLMDNVSVYMYRNLEKFFTEDNEVLFQLNDLTDGQLFYDMASDYEDWNQVHNEKIKELFVLLAEKWKKLNESLKRVKSFRCKCGAMNHVQFIDNSTKCQECDQLFYDFN